MKFQWNFSMKLRVTPSIKKQEIHLEILGGGCARAKQVSDGAIAPSSPALAPPLAISE